MAFSTNRCQQFSLLDSYNALSERSRNYVINSWASAFALDIFPAINEERFAVLYSSHAASRSNTPVNIIIGAMILKELLVLTDDEVLGSLICDIRFQYALRTTSYVEQPLSDRSFSRFRERNYLFEQETGRDLLKEEILSLSKVIENLMNLNPTMKRMDSLMIASNCKNMTRLDVLYTCVSNMVKAVRKTGEDGLLSGIEHYLEADDHNRVIYHNKNEETDTKIQEIINDATKLLADMGDAYFELPEYQLLRRVLTEQSDDNGDGTRKAKDKKDIVPSSVQNPSDSDATYHKKAGKDNIGFVGNVVETFDENGNSVITSYGYEQNSHSDSAFCKEVIEDMGLQEETVTLIVDGAYSGTENREAAAKNNINLVTTSLTGRLPNEIHAGFTMSEDGKSVISCPLGYIPIKNTYNPGNGTCRAVFERGQCKNCSNLNQCKAKLQNKTAVINISKKMVQRALQMAEMTTDEYKQLTRQRNAVEGIPSVLRRRYDVDHIPARGKMRSKMFFGFKIGAMNVNKLLKYYQRLRDNCAQKAVTA